MRPPKTYEHVTQEVKDAAQVLKHVTQTPKHATQTLRCGVDTETTYTYDTRRTQGGCGFNAPHSVCLRLPAALEGLPNESLIAGSLRDVDK